jgi:hypothetical protein
MRAKSWATALWATMIWVTVKWTTVKWTTVISAAVMLMLALLHSLAAAHQNDRGMDYRAYRDARGLPCCNDTDCRPASDYAEVVVNGQPMVRLLIDGDWYDVLSYFVVAENASDGRAHWCGKTVVMGDGRRRPAPICVILPPRHM